MLSREITDAERTAFREDGIVCLRGFFDADWIERDGARDGGDAEQDGLKWNPARRHSELLYS